jgi:hypothetical protein
MPRTRGRRRCSFLRLGIELLCRRAETKEAPAKDQDLNRRPINLVMKWSDESGVLDRTSAPLSGMG